MSNKELWTNFLENMKDKVSPTSFDIWFNEDETKLFSFKDNVATIIVNQDFVKKHLEENYIDMMIDAMYEITSADVTFKIISESEAEALKKEEKENKQLAIKEMDTLERQSSDNANLKQEYTFETFIVGNSNKFAYKASRVVAESPGSYNPLFLYGESGVGKTHLMHAIGNYLIQNTDKKVLYISSDKFVDEYTRIFRYNDKNNFEKIDDFKEKYRNVDVLMIDDIQFLSTAPKGQEEFFHTFNELYNANKQIIIASDRSVDDLNSLENRLLTRFNWGLTANITTPDYDLRVSIIKNKLAFKEAANDIPMDVIEYIANNYDSDIRKLEGAITRVLAYSSMFNKGKITLDIAVDALKDQLKDRSCYKNDVQRIQRAVCDYYKISIEQMKGKNRNNEVNFPRQIAIYLCRELTNESFPKIGSYFGGRNHSTIISADNRIRKELKTNDNLKEVIKDLKRNLT
ncbi:MAG: chromosomal replication initiator protein DnaA [Mycoplasmatota bacterium]|nr:chromosomal replication initiator protein DnaA [Mycoplasmatota bacterium]